MQIFDDRRQMMRMLARIAIILFAIEALIMVALFGWENNGTFVSEGLLDASLLTLFSTPTIYWWVVKPFVLSTNMAQKALADELQAKERQAEKLEDVLGQKNAVLRQNEELNYRLQLANEAVATSNERILQRIGADLHDGPAQLLSYALMRFDRLSRLVERGQPTPRDYDDVKTLRAAITDTLREIRYISVDLSPPNIDHASLIETLDVAVAAHEQHTGTVVQKKLSATQVVVSKALNICVYRFAQEALSNAYQHAGGIGQIITLHTDVENGLCRLVVSVSDAGPGFCPEQVSKNGLGLAGMRARIEAIGGVLDIVSSPSNGGTILTAKFDIEPMECAV